MENGPQNGNDSSRAMCSSSRSLCILLTYFFFSKIYIHVSIVHKTLPMALLPLVLLPMSLLICIGSMGSKFLEKEKMCHFSHSPALAGARCAALSVIILRGERRTRGKMETAAFGVERRYCRHAVQQVAGMLTACTMCQLGCSEVSQSL